MPKHPKRPRDINQWAKLMVDLATGIVEEAQGTPQVDEGKDPAAVELGRKGSKKGGVARPPSLSSAEKAIAKKGEAMG